MGEDKTPCKTVRQPFTLIRQTVGHRGAGVDLQRRSVFGLLGQHKAFRAGLVEAGGAGPRISLWFGFFQDSQLQNLEQFPK